MRLPIDEQNLINILGIQSLPDEKKLKLIDDVTDLVQRRLLLRVLNSLPDKKRKEFEDLLDTENQDAINIFFEQNAPDLPNWLIEEIGKIKQELGALAQAV